MPFKAEEPAAGALGLFPKGAGTKPKEGEIQPSDFFKFEADMNCALSKIAPIDATVPRRLGMRQFFTPQALCLPLQARHLQQVLRALFQQYRLASATL